MATVVSTPVVAYVATLMASTSITQSTSLTATCNNTATWEMLLPITYSHAASYSADPVVNVYASSDGGASYDTTPFISVALPRLSISGANAFGRQSIVLPTGIWCVQMLLSGPNTGAFGIPTAQIVTAYNNV